jgi:hypothetical protein
MKPNAEPLDGGPILEASAAGAAAATGSTGGLLLLFTVMFPNKLSDPDDAAGAGAAGAGSVENEKLPSKSPLDSVDSVDTNAGVAGELVEGIALPVAPFMVIPPNIESPPDVLLTAGGAGGGGAGALTGAGTSDGPSKSNRLGASAAVEVTVGGAAKDGAAPPFILVGGETTPGATPSKANTLFAGAFTECLA